MSRFFTLILFFGAITCAAANPPLFPFNSDTIPPVITCPPDETIDLGPSQCETVFTYDVFAFDDTLEIVPGQWAGIASGEVFPVGTTLNIFVATDSLGNSSDCSFSVTVVSDTSALICRDTFLAYLGADCWTAPGITDLLLGDYGCSLSLLAELDKTAPLGDGPWVGMFLDDTDKSKWYSFRVTDLLSSASCAGVLHVLDTVPPVLDCQTVRVPCIVPQEHLLPHFLLDSLAIWEGQPMVSDACGGDIEINFVDIPTEYPCDSIGVAGIITRFWTALDAANNVATCVQTIERHRSVDDVQFPFDGTFDCFPVPYLSVTGRPYFDVNGLQYSLSDTTSCGIVVEYLDSEQINCGASRYINRLWTVKDGCLPDSLSNPAMGVQIVEILDELEPLLSCPTDTVVVINGSDCMGVVNMPDIVVGDACSYVQGVTAYWTVGDMQDSLAAELGDFPGNNPSTPDTLAIFGEIQNLTVGTSVILLIASDACGNTSECEINLIVLDSIPPTAQCDTFLTAFLDDKGLASLPAGLFDDGSVDACSQLEFKTRRSVQGVCDTLENDWSDFVNLCCADLGDTLTIELRVYDVPVPPGIVTDSFALGHFSACTTSLLILDISNPQCIAPADTVVACENFDPDLSIYGFATFSCTVDSVVTTANYLQFDTVCSRGTIARIFQVFNALGTSGQCAQQIVVENEQNYFVRFPDDLVIMACDTAGNYGAPAFFGTGCENMVATFTETTLFGVPDACLRIERVWTIYNACIYDAGSPLIQVPNPEPNSLAIHPENLPGPIVSEAGTTGDWAPTFAKIAPNSPDTTDYSTFWSANVNGYSYKQIIRVIDQEMPVIEDCPTDDPTYTDLSDNDPHLWNANFSADPGNPAEDLCEGGADLRITVTDACFGNNLGVDYLLFLDLDGDGSQETVVNSTDLPLPGTIQYNNAGTPNYSGGQTRLYDSRPVAQNAKYQFALRADTVGRRQLVRLVWYLPATPGSGIQPQLPLGNHRIRWTVYDNCGNETSCEYGFRVEDPDGTCAPTTLTVGGFIKTETMVGIENVAVQLDVTHPTLPAFTEFALTDGLGTFSFSVPTGSSYTIKPFRDSDPLNGVSTFDLLLINKHVLGLESLASAYKILAADANKSNTVTTFDIVEFRKLILGIYQQLPLLPSWRFVPANHVFSNPAIPFMGGFQEQITVTNLQPGDLPAHDFIGFKVGDVNGNALPGFVGDDTDDRSGAAMYFDLSDRNLEAGDEFSVTLRADQLVAGMQFTLDFAGLELLDLMPLGDISEEHFAVFNSENSLTASWETGGYVAFELRFRTKEGGLLRDKLRLSNRITRTEAYSNNLELLQVALRFNGEAVAAAGFELFQNQPNPFSEDTGIGFYLPEAKPATLRVWDSTGRLLWEKSGNYQAGRHFLQVNADMLGAGIGVLYYQLETDTDRAVRKMIRQVTFR